MKILHLKSTFYHIVSVFILAFLIIYVLYTGLPFDFSQDLVIHVTTLQTLGYPELLDLTLSPFTPAWFYIDEVGYLRPIFYLIHKVFFDTFGPSLLPIHIAVAFGHGLLAVALFLIALIITRRKWFAWLTVIFYASIPTNAVMLAGYLSIDLQFYLSLISLGAIASLGYLTFSPDLSRQRKVLLIIMWIVLTWVAIKWKSSEKLLPLIYLAFLCTRFPSILKRIGKPMFGLLLLINILMFVLVIPFKMIQGPQMDYGQRRDSNFFSVYTRKDQRMFQIRFDNLIARTFKMPDSENPLMSPVLKKAPNTFTGDLGFLLGWVFWISLAVYILRTFLNKRLRTSKTNPEPHITHFGDLTLIWFAITVGAFASGAPLGEVRYLNFAIVPGLLLLAFCFRYLENLFSERRFLIKTLCVLTMVGFLTAGIQNYPFLLKWVTHFCGMQNALYESDKLIYERAYNKKPTPLDLYLSHNDLEKRFVVVGWYDLASDWFENATERLTKEGILFLKVRSSDDAKLDLFVRNGFRVELLNHFFFYDASPSFFRFQKWLFQKNVFRKKPPEIALYKILPR